MAAESDTVVVRPHEKKEIKRAVKAEEVVVRDVGRRATPMGSGSGGFLGFSEEGDDDRVPGVVSCSSFLALQGSIALVECMLLD